MNEFNEELEKFIEETVKKAVDEQTAKTIENTVKNVFVEYCVETNNQIALLQTELNTLMNILIVNRFPSAEEIKAIMKKSMKEKSKELNKKISAKISKVQESEKSEKPKS